MAFLEMLLAQFRKFPRLMGHVTLLAHTDSQRCVDFFCAPFVRNLELLLLCQRMVLLVVGVDEI